MPANYVTPGANRTVRRRSRRRHSTMWAQLLRGLLFSICTTLVCILVFALLMQWIRPSDNAIRIINQLIKLFSIFIGARFMLRGDPEKGLVNGALLGLCYMALGVGLYALLSGQQLPFAAYLSDIAMGVAGGGIFGAILQGFKH